MKERGTTLEAGWLPGDFITVSAPEVTWRMKAVNDEWRRKLFARTNTQEIN
jgi:hypothetical protein